MIAPLLYLLLWLGPRVDRPVIYPPLQVTTEPAPHHRRHPRRPRFY